MYTRIFAVAAISLPLTESDCHFTFAMDNYGRIDDRDWGSGLVLFSPVLLPRFSLGNDGLAVGINMAGKFCPHQGSALRN